MNQLNTISRDLLAKADIYRLLTLSFSYPDRETVESLRSVSGDMDLNTIPADCREMFRALRNSAADVTTEEIEGEYNELYTTRMFCPPYETSYGRHSFSKPETLADISAFYKAFGFSVAGGEEMLDSIAVEMEFMSLLMIKEAYGEENGLSEMTDVCNSARRKFLAEHLGKWAGAFFRNLKSKTTKDFYRDLAGFAEKFIESEIREYGIDVEYSEGVVRDQINNEPISCPVQENMTD